MFRFSAIVRKLPVAAGRRRKSIKAYKTSRTGMEDHRPSTFIPSRSWVNTKLHDQLEKGECNIKPDQTAFTLVSYNILAQDLLESHRDLYTGIPEEHLKWTLRKRRILNEVTNLRPDILCVQEIQVDHLEGFTSDLLRRCTFERVFKKRTGIEKTDGCAIFFNPDMFELIDQRTIEFNQDVNLLDRDNVGLVIKLRCRNNPKSVFIVATTHLLFNPRRLDIKLAQVHVLLAELEQMSFNRSYNEGYYPIILTGDFNLEPTSTPYHLLANGKIDYQQLAQKQPIISDELGITDNCQHVTNLKYGREVHQSRLNNSDREETNSRSRNPEENSGYETHFNTGYLSHPLYLTSSYRDFTERSSTHHHDWIVVDYLFYSRYFNSKFQRVTEGALKLLQYLDLPRIEECQRMGQMPNEVLGSDHFSLAARFLLGRTGG